MAASPLRQREVNQNSQTDQSQDGIDVNRRKADQANEADIPHHLGNQQSARLVNTMYINTATSEYNDICGFKDICHIL